MPSDYSICCDAPITEMGYCSDCKEPTGSYSETIADEQEYESRQINSLIGTLVGLALLLSSVAFIAGFASAGALR